MTYSPPTSAGLEALEPELIEAALASTPVDPSTGLLRIRAEVATDIRRQLNAVRGALGYGARITLERSPTIQLTAPAVLVDHPGSP